MRASSSKSKNAITKLMPDSVKKLLLMKGRRSSKEIGSIYEDLDDEDK